MENVTELNTKQKMLVFAFLADITSGVVFDPPGEQDSEFPKELQKALNFIVTSSVITPYLGEGWSCHDYPWVDIERDHRGVYLSRNTTAIFVNGNEVVVGVAGTNFVENYDWFTEDLGVAKQEPWADVVKSLSGATPGDSDPSQGVISEGTVIALTNTWSQKGSISGNKLVDDLKDVVSGMDEIHLTVTGHSLGGAISPVLAQALWELREQWMPASATVTVAAYPFAGPTVGNQTFVDYVQPEGAPEEGKIQLVSTYNTKDVVPHGWNLSMMNQMHDLFSPTVPDADTDEHGALIKATLKWLLAKSESVASDDSYVRWNKEDTFAGSFPTGVDHFLFEQEAEVFATFLRGMLESPANWGTRSAMQEICDALDLSNENDAEKLFDCMVYLGKYLLMLARQHISEYSANVYDNETFQKTIKEYTDFQRSRWSTGKDKKAGMNVLQELFVDVAKTVPLQSGK